VGGTWKVSNIITTTTIITIIINTIQSVDIKSIPLTVIVFVTFATNKIPHIIFEYPNKNFHSHHSGIIAIKSTAIYRFHANSFCCLVSYRFTSTTNSNTSKIQTKKFMFSLFLHS